MRGGILTASILFRVSIVSFTDLEHKRLYDDGRGSPRFKEVTCSLCLRIDFLTQQSHGVLAVNRVKYGS